VYRIAWRRFDRAALEQIGQLFAEQAVRARDANLKTRLRVTALLEVMLLLVGPQVGAQKSLDAVLAGVDSVDAQVALTWDARIPNLDENTVRSRLQTVLELELRQH